MIDTTKPPPADKCGGCKSYPGIGFDCYASLYDQADGRLWEINMKPLGELSRANARDAMHPIARWGREGPRCSCGAVAFMRTVACGMVEPVCDSCLALSDWDGVDLRPLAGSPTRSERIAYELERRARGERYEVVCDVTDVEELL